MQKPANRILSMMLALVMIISMVPATVFASGDADSPFAGWSLTLGENIGVNFYLAEEAGNYSVDITVAGNPAAYTTANTDGYYVVTVGVAAAQMTDAIVLNVANGDETVHTGEYSVRQYAETILEGSYDSYVKDLVKKMLNFGAAAQNYFGYNTENLANRGYETVSASVPAEIPQIVPEGSLAGISLYGMSLVFESRTAVRFYFKVTGDIAGYTFKANGETYEPVLKNDMYYVEVGNINPQDLGNVITLSVNDTLSVSYSPMNYIARMNANGSDSLKALVQAMYGYYLEAVYYNSVVDAGAMAAGSNGWSAGGIYVTMAENDAYYVDGDWSVEYTPVSADVIKLVRGGNTYNVGIPGQGTLVKYNATNYYFKTEPWTITGGVLPVQDQDYFIVEGRFEHTASGSVMNISKTYIYNNGGKLEFSTTEPTLPTTYELGSLIAHPDSNNNWNSGGVYMALAEATDAPYKSDWTLEYAPTSSSVIKRIRDGVTIDVAIAGRGTLVMYGDTLLYMNINSWTMGENQPAQDGDIYIIEGDFYNEANKATITIAKTYVYLNGADAEFSTEMPTLPATYALGSLIAHPDSNNNWNSGGVYMGLAAATGAPYKSDWTLEYAPTSSSVIKRIRDGVTIDVAIAGRGTLVMYGDTLLYMNINSWTMGENQPAQDGDIYIIEGNFYNEANKATITIAKTYVYLNGADAEFSTEMPTLPSVIDGGNLTGHSNKELGATGLYFAMAANDAPYNSDWSYEYKQTSVDAIKRIRDGVTTSIGIVGRPMFVKYSETEYYLKLEGWTLGDNAKLQANDVLVIEGDFYHEASKTTLHIAKSYIYYDGSSISISTEMPTLPATYALGSLIAHPDSNNNWTPGGVYMALAAATGAPYKSDWTLEYAPTSSSVIKRIRDGVTIDVAIAGRGTLVMHGDTLLYMNINSWTMGENQPAQDGDIYIIEGNFYNEANKATITIAKTYVYLNGADAEFSTEMPTLPTTVLGGMMQTHPNGMSGTGIYFAMAENDATFVEGDWGYEYKQTTVNGIKLIRNGVTTSIGIVGRPLLVKYGATNYFLKLEGWSIGDYGLNSTNPITTDDVLIIEGDFIHEASKVTLNIQKTYVYFDGNAWVCAAVLPVEVIAGNMTSHAEGWDAADGLYFTLDANDLPVDENAETYYDAASGVIKLVRGNESIAVNGSLVKFGESDYYLTLNSSLLPLKHNDYLIVEGAFKNAENGYTLVIAKTYILVSGDNLVFSESEPVLETEYAVNGLTNHGNGWTADGIYITHNAHDAYFNSNWSVEYKPVSADAIKLIRGGVTYSIGQPASGTLVVYSNTAMYLKTAAWTIQGGVLPFVDGDIIVVEGKFIHKDSGNILVVEKTVICVNDADLIFNPIMAGTLANHANGVGGDGIYATMAENAAPYDGWNIEYTPVTADAYYVIRNGEQINIGIPGRGTLVKYSATDYYLKINAWCTNNFAYTTDDIIVIDGYWKQNTGGNAIMKMEKTYLYYNGASWTFGTSLPSIVNGGHMQTHGTGMSGTGIYFNMVSNAAPYNSDWSLEYKQTSADNVKLIRGGQTISIGIAGRPLFLKYSDTGYYLKLEGWTIGEYGLNSTNPITTDDILIIEGNFVYEAGNVTMNIAKTYVYYDGSAWVCSENEPAKKNIVDVLELGSHSNGWTTGGFYFTAAQNTAPFNTDWSLRYKPLSADAIKLIHDGVTTNKGNTGAETIVKYGETTYYIEGWAVGMSNVVAGDVMIIEGLFYNAAHDTYIQVEKTTITFNADGSTTVISESGKYINAGNMNAYTPGPNWFGSGIYFTMAPNNAPANGDWTVRYMPKKAGCIKLIRGGNIIEIGNTGAETIVNIGNGQYWLSLEDWWFSAFAPIVDGDMLVIEGEFTNAANGYTLNIAKTVITFESKSGDSVMFSVPANTEFGEVLLPTSGRTLNIGMWNGSHHVFNDARLAELKAAGITKIMGIDTQWLGTTDVEGWLDRVYSYGIRVIIDLRSWDGVTVPSYVNHPALMGFLMFDEPCATDFEKLKTLKDKFDAVMPEDILFYVNLYPSCAAGTSLMGGLDWALGKRDYDKYYVQKFLDTLGVEVLSWDNYSLLSGTGIRTDYFYNFEVMAGKDGEKWYTMLTSGHNTTTTSYATPTAEELRWQMAVAMTYGIYNIDHYTYTSHEEDYSTMLDFDTETVTDLYYDVKDVDNEYLAWDNIFMAYNWIGVGVSDVGDNSEMFGKLKNKLNLSDYGIDSISSTEDMLVGVFDHNGEKAYMITNAGTAGSSKVGDGKNFIMNDGTVTLNLGEGSYKCVAVIDRGEISYVAVNADNSVTLNVQAYEGLFVIPVLN